MYAAAGRRRLWVPYAKNVGLGGDQSDAFDRPNEEAENEFNRPTPRKPCRGGRMIERAPSPRRDFVIVQNAVARDKRLSYKARGVLVFLLSQPPGYRTSAERIAAESTDGRHAVLSGLRELEQVGYLRRTKQRLPDGTFRPLDVVYDTPERDQPQAENRLAVPPAETNVLAGRTGSRFSDVGEVADKREELEIEELEEPKPLSASADVQAVFDAWVEATGRTGRTQLNDDRAGIIRRWLKRYPVADLVDAVSGWRWSPHHRGENDRGTVYNDLQLLLRNSGNIEKFRDYERGIGRPQLRALPSRAQQREQNTRAAMDRVFNDQQIGLGQ